MKGAVSAQKALQVSEKETKVLLRGTEGNSVSLMREFFYTSGPPNVRLPSPPLIFAGAWFSPMFALISPNTLLKSNYDFKVLFSGVYF